MSAPRATSASRPNLTRADCWGRRTAFGVTALLLSALIFVIVGVFRHDNRVAQCKTESEIVELLGPATRTFVADDEEWKGLCQAWGCRPLRGEPQRSTWVKLHEGTWLWTGYLVFYDGDTIVAVHALGNG